MPNAFNARSTSFFGLRIAAGSHSDNRLCNQLGDRIIAVSNAQLILVAFLRNQSG
jgi:hypothetical protein